VLRYRNPATGELAQVSVQVPCAPALLRALEVAFAKNGFVRVEAS
jgi:hypothetical protein